jgi:hypothetical protein
MSCTVSSVRVSDCQQFISKHYLGKRPAIVLLCLMMSHGEKPVGCIIYSAPPREVDKRYGCTTWELSRLYLLDEIPRNAETWLIGKSVKHIKHHFRGVGCLISYADPSVGHAGTIYRAASWSYDGMTDAGRKTPRCDYVDGKTGKKYGRKGNMPHGAEIKRIPRIPKHRFYLRLK